MKPLRSILFAAVLLGGLAGPAAPDALIGIWRTMPDAKAQTGDVQVYRCGGALCGKLIRAHDRAGTEIVTANPGKRILWGMQDAGGGRCGGGRVLVPIMKRDFPVELAVNGNLLKLRACNGIGLCRSRTWRRVK